ncbi:hypothetical protein N7539_006894 [Penicillium diatomitis]|uniref:Uncharacterized protein n=1 Tax=Penicillium diatomitis TaxID=2819901 RepID=A0A9W9X2F6_9EURO|nr:uncharacterized protein N7539_006894 [Penicillium diatomitis]KAJ5481000.1 hypothetical protein N7539_006894 [Penicillium diatomitis]
MAMSFQSMGLGLLIILMISGQAHAFGAGNIASLSKIEGMNWRHGDIEDALLSLVLARVAGGRKFSKLDVKRVYFGNWLRDYSQAVDVGTVKYVSAEAIRVLIWVLGFLTFGYGTAEFEVTTERLGCYQPTEHIDNPLGYAEGADARHYDRRLRGPVDEERELSIDTRTGLKNYIASEDLGIDTSAALIRRTLGGSVELGRRYARSGNKEDLHEALRLLGTGLHCLEDYAAHSNYTELSLIELGERGVFPHVGRNTMVQIHGAQEEVYPIVTGTFGGVDFFHSVLGEFSDKTKQSELQELEGVIADSQNQGETQSMLQELLGKIPSGLIGSGDQAGKMDDFKNQSNQARQDAQNFRPHDPEEWVEYVDNVQKQIYPVLQWHDELLKSINEAIEKIPVLPDLIENIQDQITVFVFSVIAPYILPIISQAKAELETGSSEVIQSSRAQQHVVFNDDYSSNPTHSMLSKDHFSNVLNEPAGRIASEVVKWTVPQLMQCWDHEDADVDRTLNRIISGVFHHPALRHYGDDGAADIRQIMFSTVENWWNEKHDHERDELRDQLSRDGVRQGRNHKEGVEDCGHGCGKPLSLPKPDNSGQSGAMGDCGYAYTESESNQQSSDNGLGKLASQVLGGGALGGLVGGLVGKMGSMALEGNSSGNSEQPGYGSEQEYSHEERPSHSEYGRPAYGSQPEYSHEERPSHSEYGRPEYGSSQFHGEQPPPRNDYVQQDYRSEYASEVPYTQSYRREEHHESHGDNSGYYERQSHQTYESGESEYRRTETRYEYDAPQPSYETRHHTSYNGGAVVER